MPLPPNTPRLLALAGSLALSACAHSTAPNEASAMSTPTVSRAAPLDASGLLKSLLGLIRDTHRVQDITPDRLHTATGLDVETWGPTRFGIRGDLTPRWRYIADVDVARQIAPGMEFAFVPTEAGSHPDTGEICAFGFDAVDRELRESGFDGRPHFGEHGEVLWHDYTRGGLSVQVASRGAVTATTANACVTSVVVR